MRGVGTVAFLVNVKKGPKRRPVRSPCDVNVLWSVHLRFKFESGGQFFFIWIE